MAAAHGRPASWHANRDCTLPCCPLACAGEISSLQADALRATLPAAGLPGLQVRQSSAAQQRASRAHLEASLHTALALQSAGEYRRWLLAYARFLAEQADAARLSEVCAALLGCGAGAGDDVPMADAEGGELDGGEGSASGGGWQPTVLGLQKRELLREVLREMSRNRALQRTTQTYVDALAELERAAAAQAAAAQAAAEQAAAAQAAEQQAALQAAAAAAAVAAPQQQQQQQQPAPADGLPPAAQPAVA